MMRFLGLVGNSAMLVAGLLHGVAGATSALDNGFTAATISSLFTFAVAMELVAWRTGWPR